MRKNILIAFIVSLCALAGCSEEAKYSDWEEKWEESAAGDHENSSREENKEDTSVTDSEQPQLELPKTYSLKEQNLVIDTEMVDIHAEAVGIDGAYTALTAIESNLIVQGKANVDNIDLSEAHLVYYSTLHQDRLNEETTEDGQYLIKGGELALEKIFYGGHTYAQVIPNLANGVGPVSEELVPFEPDNREKVKECLAQLMEKEANASVSRTSADWFLQDANYLDVKDIDTIKRTIMEKGALQLQYYFSPAAFSENLAHYNPSSLSMTNKTAVIVGWDDGFSKENFGTNKPEKDGAWLVKENFTMIGPTGYIWVSYEDTSIQDIVSYEMCARSAYGEVMYHDTIGYRDTIKTDEEYTTIANVFTLDKTNDIKAVGIYTIDPEQTLEVTVYGNPIPGTPDNGDKLASFSLEQKYAGYHVIDLETPISLNTGDTFSIVVKYLNAEECGNAPVEGETKEDLMAGLKMLNNFVSEEGESYAFYGGQWYDLSVEDNAEVFSKAEVINNACIKAVLAK